MKNFLSSSVGLKKQKYMLNFVAHDFVTCMVRITANQIIFA